MRTALQLGQFVEEFMVVTTREVKAAMVEGLYHAAYREGFADGYDEGSSDAREACEQEQECE